jgi:hypothetical protein
MKKTIVKVLPLVILIMVTSGCARYANSVNMLYDPISSVRGMSGDLFVSIAPPVKRNGDFVWVLGDVTDDDGKVIDHLTSPRSAAELVQAALVQEFKQSGYTVISTTNKHAEAQRAVEVSRAEVVINQVSDFADIKATCKLLVGLNIRKNGVVIRKLQYETKYTKTDIKDRDLLVRTVFHEALQSAMRQAIPEITAILEQR